MIMLFNPPHAKKQVSQDNHKIALQHIQTPLNT